MFLADVLRSPSIRRYGLMAGSARRLFRPYRTNILEEIRSMRGFRVMRALKSHATWSESRDEHQSF
ncbi:hypothetical protein WG66_016699 [Moniliophthora roreri]|nr:hypothetical protein WG66_016699 [Moniliophthora roreri]